MGNVAPRAIQNQCFKVMKICIELTPEQEATVRRYLTEVCETDGNIQQECQDMIRRAVSVYADALPAKPEPNPIWENLRFKSHELYHEAYSEFFELIQAHGPLRGRFQLVTPGGGWINIERIEVNEDGLCILDDTGANIMLDQSKFATTDFMDFCESIDIHIKTLTR